MSASSVVSLRKALHAALAADAALAALLGGARIHDEAPRGAEPPYLTFGDARARDWSTGTDKGAEHALVIDADAPALDDKTVQRLAPQGGGQAEDGFLLGSALLQQGAEDAGKVADVPRDGVFDAVLEPLGLTWTIEDGSLIVR